MMAHRVIDQAIGLARFLIAGGRIRVADFTASTLCSTVAATVFSLRQSHLPIAGHLILGNVLLCGLVHVAVLSALLAAFVGRASNLGALYHLGRRDLRTHALEWSRAHYVQLAAVPMILSASPVGAGWFLVLWLLSYLGVLAMAGWFALRLFQVTQQTGRSAQPLRDDQLVKNLDADPFVRGQADILEPYEMTKRGIRGEFRNSVTLGDRDLAVRFPHPVKMAALEIAVAAPVRGSQEGRITAYADEHKVLEKPVSMLHEGWNDFRHLADEADPRTVSTLRVASSGARGASVSFRCARPAAAPQHLVVIVVDGLRKDLIGLYNPASTRTPSIDRFFRPYARYQDAYTQGEWTLPSFASMATSLYSSHHLVVNPRYDKARPLPADRETLAELLQRNGYHTFGYLSHSRTSQLYGHARGYDRFTFSREPRSDKDLTHKALEFLCAHPDEPTYQFLHYVDMRVPVEWASPFVWNGAGLMTERMLDLLRIAESGRTHEQAGYVSTVYGNKLREVDFLLGIFFAVLEQSPFRDNTAVILTSDHGINLPTDSIDAWAKKHLSEERLGVPLLLRCPWREETRGQVYRGLVESCIDLYPTVAELAGIEATTSAYSRSILPDKQGRFTGKPRAISEMIFKGDYMCRILDNTHEYIRRFNWIHGGSSEELNELSSRRPVPPTIPSYGASIAQFRDVMRELDLVQPDDDPTVYYG